jgi:hypothetical protein
MTGLPNSVKIIDIIFCKLYNESSNIFKGRATQLCYFAGNTSAKLLSERICNG